VGAEMKIRGGISTGNIIVIIMIIASFAMAWGVVSSNQAQFRSELDRKADKELVNINFEYIKQQLADIKRRLQ